MRCPVNICHRCRWLIENGASIARGDKRFHPRCIVKLLLAAPRASAATTARIFNDVVPVAAR